MDFDIAPRQVGGKLAREQEGVRAREIYVAVEVDAQRVDHIVPALYALDLVYEQVGAALWRHCPFAQGVEVIRRLDAALQVFEVHGEESPAFHIFCLDRLTG